MTTTSISTDDYGVQKTCERTKVTDANCEKQCTGKKDVEYNTCIYNCKWNPCSTECVRDKATCINICFKRNRSLGFGQLIETCPQKCQSPCSISTQLWY